jgi:tryptophan synthase alpha chain
MDRYADLFTRLEASHEGAFVPFVVIGDPDPSTSLQIITSLIEAGADALELGIPFSDPIADGPTIQAASQRALAAGVTPAACFELLGQVRADHPGLPLGLLVYANLISARGPEAFYRRAAAAGVDSVLAADVPEFEAKPFVQAAREQGVAPVLIASRNTPDDRLARIAELGQAYTYVVARDGVTGVGEEIDLPAKSLFDRLRELGAPPPLLGFGISKPEHVRAALAAGAAGAISGSAVVERMANALEDRTACLESLTRFANAMKAATREAFFGGRCCLDGPDQ